MPAANHNSPTIKLSPEEKIRFENVSSAFGLITGELTSSEIPMGRNLLSQSDGFLSVGMPQKLGFLESKTYPKVAFYSPKPIRSCHSVFFASSRLRQDLESIPHWFDGLRTSACQMRESDSAFLTSPKIASHRFVRRAAELFEIRLLEFHPVHCHSKSFQLTAMRYEQANQESEYRQICFYWSLEGNESPQPDLLLAEIANETRVLSVKGNGNTKKLIEARLSQNKLTRILMPQTGRPSKIANELARQGGIAWYLYENETDPENQRVGKSKPNAHSDFVEPLNVPLLELSEIDSSRFLLHWTRRRVGKWPDQSEDEFLDDLIFNSGPSRHDATAALCRILASESIMGFNELTRSDVPVVCFTEVPLEDLVSKTVFRPHKSRWDFAPFGIAIEKEVLLAAGTRRVIYGNEETWQGLRKTDQPFFQLSKTRHSEIDWQEEQEWRHQGTVDLRKLGPQSAFVFVPDHDSARIVGKLSRWPVVVLPDAKAV